MQQSLGVTGSLLEFHYESASNVVALSCHIGDGLALTT